MRIRTPFHHVALGSMRHLLFATNNQINLAHPRESALAGNVDIVVTYGYGTAGSRGNLKQSAAFQVTAVATNPGVFTIGADGQGGAAALNAAWATITQADQPGRNEIRSAQTPDSDTIQVYMTGLGIPDSTAADSTGGNKVYPDDCIQTTNYMNAVNAQASTSLTTLDGAIIQSSLIDSISRTAPCMATTNVPTVDGRRPKPAIVTYAGWVADSIAGLYQVNPTLPTSVLSPAETLRRLPGQRRPASPRRCSFPSSSPPELRRRAAREMCTSGSLPG